MGKRGAENKAITATNKWRFDVLSLKSSLSDIIIPVTAKL